MRLALTGPTRTRRTAVPRLILLPVFRPLTLPGFIFKSFQTRIRRLLSSRSMRLILLRLELILLLLTLSITFCFIRIVFQVKLKNRVSKSVRRLIFFSFLCQLSTLLILVIRRRLRVQILALVAKVLLLLRRLKLKFHVSRVMSVVLTFGLKPMAVLRRIIFGRRQRWA